MTGYLDIVIYIYGGIYLDIKTKLIDLLNKHLIFLMLIFIQFIYA